MNFLCNVVSFAGFCVLFLLLVGWALRYESAKSDDDVTCICNSNAEPVFVELLSLPHLLVFIYSRN